MEDASPEPLPAARRFSVLARIRSFRHAIDGLRELLRSEHNSWVHLAATVAVLAAGFALRVTLADWRSLCLAIALVWITEALNTALEWLCDLVSPGFHPQVKRIKDVSAGAVLVAAVTAAVVGALVFWPYLAIVPGRRG